MANIVSIETKNKNKNGEKIMNSTIKKSLTLVTLLTASLNVCAQDNGRLVAGAGIFGAFDNGQIATGKLGYEFAPMTDYWNIRPLTQVLATDKGAYHVSVGGIRDFDINDKWSWAIAFSAGYYHEDSSKSTDELGYDVQFYSAISTSYKIDKQSAVRAELGHISNGSLGDKNPGSESVLVSYVFNF